MGIPKFFRWMSHRYPVCIQYITPSTTPEYDNLYLDLTIIVHNCTYRDSDDPHLRFSEEEIWTGVFIYIDHIVAKIKPKRLIFLALSGVGPRAKMNQQRVKRFRAAKDSESNQLKALARGEVIPKVPRFDSSSVTAGTEFMANLTDHLRYFIRRKISEDVNWRGVKVILSGPDVPGESEQKISDYIRLAKAQPDYNPDIRHCLYGLSADLVILGLIRHDPLIALLREETHPRKKFLMKTTQPESQTFILVHFSLLRESLNLEFLSLKDSLPFEYDLERIIDDFVLFVLLLGSALLPNLPDLHIYNGSLNQILDIYKNRLPTFDGYITDDGSVNLERLRELLGHLKGSTAASENMNNQQRPKYYMEKICIDVENKDAIDSVCQAYVTGIQWMLEYYYHGVPSWRWFYPYYYAPMITDLLNLEQFQKAKFDLGKPLGMYEQLMCVLPKFSKSLLPAPYQELMTSTMSPILDFYPSEAENDLNGKCNDWEAVIKLPFIEEERLLEAMKPHKHLMTEKEKEREPFGDSYSFIYDESALGPSSDGKMHPSSLPDIFPDICPCLAREQILHLAQPKGGLVFSKLLSEVTKLRKKALPGVPTLETIRHTGELRLKNDTRRLTKNMERTMVVTLVNRFQNSSANDIAKKMLKKCVFVHYPYLQEAFVVGISDEQYEYRIDQGHTGQMIVHLLTEDEKSDMCRCIARFSRTTREQLGIEVGQSKIQVHVRTLRGMRKTGNGAYVKVYAGPEQEERIPLHVVVTGIDAQDRRYIERQPIPIDEDFPIGSKAFVFGNARYIRLGTVVGHSELDKADVQVATPLDDHFQSEPTFGHKMAKKQTEETRYTPFLRVSQMLNLKPSVLSRITSPLTVLGTGSTSFNLGLNFRFQAKQQKVLGYTRKVPGGDWEYSDKAIDLIREYKEAFPMFIKYLRPLRTDTGTLRSKDLLRSSDVAMEVPNMQQWLNTKGVDKLRRTALTTELFEEPLVKHIVAEATKYHNEYVRLPLKKIVIKHVPRSGLLKPEDAEAMLHAQKFRLGDRVVYALKTGVARLGDRGTVVAVKDHEIDVVFDSDENLIGQCFNSCGLSLPFSSAINLSYPAFRQ